MSRSLVAAAVGAASLALALPGLGTAGGATATATAIVEPATAVTLGQVSTDTTRPPGGCPPLAGVQSAVGGAPGYTTPSAGVVTSFSYNANSRAGQIRALFFAPTTTPGTWALLAKSSLASITPSTRSTIPSRIPVPAGAVLGLQTTVSGMNCAGPGAADDVSSYSSVYNPDTSATLTVSSNVPGYRWNISVVLESDADGDGYGDVSQDLCPQSAQTQAACPVPNTRIKKEPPRTSTHRSVLVTFRSTVRQSSFTCSLDHGRYRTCSSPYRKTLDVGRHLLKIRAVGPFGGVEAKPAKVRFTITESPG